MIPIAESDPPSPAISLGGTLLRGVPHAYAVLFFSANLRLGWWLLAVSLLTPSYGLAGLAGVCATGILAWWLGYDRASIRNGFLLFNPLLACFTVAYLHRSYHFSAQTYVLLWSSAVLGTFFLSVALQAWFATHVGTSAHSLPAMLAGYVIYLTASALFGPMLRIDPSPDAWLDLPNLPPFLQAMFQAFGAMLFELHAIPGLLVFVGLALTAPLSTLLATASFALGVLTFTQLDIPFSVERLVGVGFNFVLTGIALGAGYFIVSGASLLLSMSGAALCALVALALERGLFLFGLPASALPYNLVVVVLVYALRQRWFSGPLKASPSPGSLPESAVRHVLIEAQRFPHLRVPALFLPCDAERVITQAFDGPLTHRGPWQYALDFEAEKLGDKHAGTGAELADFYMYDTPVFSPCAGVVAYVVNHVADNIPGQNNPDENWGNYVILYSDAGYYVLLAHLKSGSSTVVIGQRVWPGTLLGTCGNSGRSPIPHLHLQIQPTGFLGAPTRPFCLKHYLELTSGDTKPVYRTSGYPRVNARLKPATPNAPLSDILYGWLPGEYRYRLTEENGRAWEETLVIDFDECGRYRFRSRRYAARLTAFLSEGVFYAVDYEGTDHSLLAFLAAGLARIPCIADEGAQWSDQMSTTPFYRAAERWLRDLAEPFCGPFLLAYTYRLETREASFTVHAAIDSTNGHAAAVPAHAPREIAIHLGGRRGVNHVKVRRQNDHTLEATLVDYQTAA